MPHKEKLSGDNFVANNYATENYLGYLYIRNSI